MKLGNLLKMFNQQDTNQNGYITEEQVSQIIEDLFQCKKEYQLYYDNLLLKGCKEFGIEDIIMLINEIEYYEELKITVLQQQKELNLSQEQTEMYMSQLEANQRDKRRIDYLCNPLIKDLIVMLKDYYKICCTSGDVKEMHRVENRIEEIRKKQQKRWRHYVLHLQKYQETLIQKNAYQHQYKQQKKWNEFVVDFQNNKFYKFNQLIENQKKTIKEASKQILDELQPKVFKVSKKILELRAKQKQLLKIKEFEQAEKVREEADLLEYFEKKQQDAELKNKVKSKLKLIKKKQSCQLSAFMQKVASEQTTHLLQKQANEYKWMNINKNCMQEINEKFNKDRIITLAARRSFDRPRTKSAAYQQRINLSHQLTHQYEY